MKRLLLFTIFITLLSELHAYSERISVSSIKQLQEISYFSITCKTNPTELTFSLNISELNWYNLRKASITSNNGSSFPLSFEENNDKSLTSTFTIANIELSNYKLFVSCESDHQREYTIDLSLLQTKNSDSSLR